MGKQDTEYLELAKVKLNQGFLEDSRTAALVSIAESLCELAIEQLRIAEAMRWKIEDDLSRHGGQIVEAHDTKC